MSQFIKVATLEEVPSGQAKLIEVQGKAIALFHVGDDFFAIDNLCTHAEAPLVEGACNDGEVECPWHGAHFNLKTGEALTPPAAEDVKAYSVQVNGSDIEIEI